MWRVMSVCAFTKTLELVKVKNYLHRKLLFIEMDDIMSVGDDTKTLKERRGGWEKALSLSLYLSHARAFSLSLFLSLAPRACVLSLSLVNESVVQLA
jgi:hypothetical protein